jgi:tetratricopeptide (TPR) repeat protein
MSSSSKTQSPGQVSKVVRAPSLRLLILLSAGLALVGGALWLRSSARMRETILSGKEISELEAAVQAQPGDALAAYYLAKRYYLARRFRDARAAYESVVRLEPASARAHLGLALSLYELGESRAARAEFERTLQLDSRSAWAEYMLGKLAWDYGSISAALPHVRRATELDPRSDPAWYALGVCYTHQRRFDLAVAALRRALARQVAFPEYHTALGEILLYRGDAAEGLRHYTRALQLDPDYGPACALLGRYYLRHATGADARRKAGELLQKAARLKTYHPEEVYLDLGRFYLDTGQYGKAVDALQHSIRLDPRDERPYFALTKACRRLGDTKAAEIAEQRFRFISVRHVAMQNLEAQVASIPGDAPARLHLARVYRDLGLARYAAQQYDAYLRLRPSDRVVAAEFHRFLQERAVAETPETKQDFVLPRPGR